MHYFTGDRGHGVMCGHDGMCDHDEMCDYDGNHAYALRLLLYHLPPPDYDDDEENEMNEDDAHEEYANSADMYPDSYVDTE